MTNLNAQEVLVIKGRNLDVSKSGGIIAGKGADILQATPRVGEAIQLSVLRSEETDTITLTNKDDVVELAFEDNLLLYTSVQRLQEEIISGAQRGGEKGAVHLPARLSFTNQRTRGEDGLLVKSVKVLDIKGKLIDAAGKKGGELAARKIAEKIEEDQLVGRDILYRIAAKSEQSEGTIELIPAEGDIDPAKPMLLFIHGTASSTQGSFSELWQPSTFTDDTIWPDLQKKYQKNIFALEHRTLTKSPIDNIVDLLEKLPVGCRLHLVSHSRGGLVGELLCRGQFNNSREPFTKEDIALFDTPKVSGMTGLFAETEKDYQQHRQQLQKLNTLLRDKQPVVERFVRVACPARGTTLASGKLDVYLSGILNVIGLIPALKASSLYDLLKAFTMAVAKERTRPEHLPGLEAQMPGSPFIAMLNSAPESVKAHLAVIKGDIEPTGILKKISMFFLDRFYESDHDLVVNTPSMDGGARRENRIPVLFDKGKDINHFRYFENSRTRQGLFFGLTDTNLPPKGFQLLEQKAVEIARTLPRGKRHDEVPSVFVLPGITGSHLGVDGNRIWIDFFDLVRGRFGDLHIAADNVTAQAPVAKAYGDLIDHLAQTHYVIPFAYDWRRSVLDTGRELGAAVDERLRNNKKQPVRIVAHSMGGLVTRAMMSQCKEVWERLRNREGSRVLMLGTPNRGSHSIARIFACQDRLIKMLALADLHHDHNELLDILRKFPGVLELLPVDENGIIDIADSLWDDFATALTSDWQRPAKTDLNKSQKTWNALSAVDLDPALVFYVAGRADETPASVTVKDTAAKTKEISFTSTKEGDGQVPWATGIPKGIKHWFVNAVHGDIPDYKPAHKAFVEILETGSTLLLATQPPVARGLERMQLMLPDGVDFFPDEDQLLAAGMGKNIRGKEDAKSAMPPLHVSVVHGNLCFVRSPLAVGHYQGDTIVSAEAVLDELLDHRLSRRQQSGVYPGPLMTNEILFNNLTNRFPGTVIVGLGEVGELTAGTLTSTFRDAVIRYVLIGRETGQFGKKPIELSTLLIGTGAGKLTVNDVVSSLIRGVVQANKILAGPTGNVDFIVSKLEFVELHEDIAIAAQYALCSIISNIEFGDTVACEKTLIVGNGGCSRAHFSEDANWWQRLRIEVTQDGGLKYTTLGDRARAEMRIQAIQRQSIEPFLKELTTQTSANDNAGRVLFELLIPPELKSHAAENQRLMLVVDKGAAAYPWELLEYAGREKNEALAIKAGMIRQLTTESYIPTNICTDLHALVVGDPFSGKDSIFPELPGAQEEARVVVKVLKKNRVHVQEPLIRETGAKILTRLMTGKFGVLHLAGHGVVDFDPHETEYDDAMPSKTKQGNKVTGMLIGENQFLTPVEIHQMPYTPAFVFINCCHLGKISGIRQPYMERRYHLAANLATQFIEQGVKAVIAAGWAVDDSAALTFAETFYEVFFTGTSFGDAVQRARIATEKMHSAVNTWGAYQCYGDPDYKMVESRDTKEGKTPQEFVALAEYLVAVKNIAENAKTATRSTTSILRERLQDLIKTIPDQYVHDAKLLGCIGDAWGELDHFAEAVKAYSSALQAQKAYATIHCAEQLANFKCRMAIEKVGIDKGDKSKNLTKEAIDLTREAIDLLLSLNKDFGESIERLSLLGSAYKRRTEIDIANRVSLQKNLLEMRDNYMHAYKKNLELNGKVYPYPLINGLTARWLLHKTSVNNNDLNDFDALLESARQAKMVPEINQEYFWDAIAATDCDLLAALKEEQLTAEKASSIADTYETIGQVASSPRQMRSVVEHIDFLYAVTAQLKLSQAKHLDELRNRLRKIH